MTNASSSRAYLFPGQGAQRIGMGSELFTRYPRFLAAANEVLGYDLAALCRDDAERLGNTAYTQPALYVVGALGYLRHVEETHLLPQALAGHSLGEYTALFAADVFDFATGLRLVQERGRLMAEARDGGMAAVLGLSPEQVQTVIAEQKLAGVHLANRNSPQQTVISGEREAIRAAPPAFLAAGASRVIPLQVSGAFHSPLMEPARERFRSVLAATAFRAPRIPVLSNVTAAWHEAGRIGERLAEQLTAPVRWDDGVRFLLAAGISDFAEMGPGEVLTRLVTQIRAA